jgi:hypothetical protein
MRERAKKKDGWWVGGVRAEREKNLFSMTDRVIKDIVMTPKVFMHRLLSLMIS